MTAREPPPPGLRSGGHAVVKPCREGARRPREPPAWRGAPGRPWGAVAPRDYVPPLHHPLWPARRGSAGLAQQGLPAAAGTRLGPVGAAAIRPQAPTAVRPAMPQEAAEPCVRGPRPGLGPSALTTGTGGQTHPAVTPVAAPVVRAGHAMGRAADSVSAVRRAGTGGCGVAPPAVAERCVRRGATLPGLPKAVGPPRCPLRLRGPPWRRGWRAAVHRRWAGHGPTGSTCPPGPWGRGPGDRRSPRPAHPPQVGHRSACPPRGAGRQASRCRLLGGCAGGPGGARRSGSPSRR